MNGPGMGMGMDMTSGMPGMPGMDAAAMLMPAFEPQEGEPRKSDDLLRIESELLSHDRQGLATAFGLSQQTKAEWYLFYRMYMTKGLRDDVDDPLSQARVWFSPVAAMADTMLSQIIMDVITNPGEMDHFRARVNWPGLEEWGRRVTALMQQKFRQMRPRGVDGGYFGLTRERLKDWAICGNQFSLWTHEQLGGDEDGDGIMAGPCGQYLDPFNVWPWATDVNNINQTDTSIYAPISEADLRAGAFKNVEEILERASAQRRSKRDPASSSRGETIEAQYIGEDENFLRYQNFARFPVWKIAKRLDASPAEIYGALGAWYDFDPSAAEQATWWQREYIGHTYCQLRPYPLPLPRGEAPVQHYRLYSVSGELWGRGIYHRVGWHERFINMMRKAVARIVKMSANPPFYYRKYMLDTDWLQLKGEDFSLEPGEGIPIADMERQHKPIELFYAGAESLQMFDQQIEREKSDSKEESKITNSFEGNEKSKTATVGRINFEQAQGYAKAEEKLYELVVLKGDVDRAFLIQQAAMRAKAAMVAEEAQGTGLPAQVAQEMGSKAASERVLVSDSQRKLESFDVPPDMMLSEELLTWQMLGLNSPGNKQQVASAMIEAFKIFGSAGIFKIAKYGQRVVEYLNVPDVDELMATLTPMELQEALANVQALGPQAMALLPPEVQEGLQNLMQSQMMQQGGMGGPGMAAPGGMPGVPALPPPPGVAGAPPRPAGPQGPQGPQGPGGGQ